MQLNQKREFIVPEVVRYHIDRAKSMELPYHTRQHHELYLRDLVDHINKELNFALQGQAKTRS